MSSLPMNDKPHSAREFTASRDFWWHADYLDLLARRLELARCTSVLELGAGLGHWTAHLIPRCAANAAFTVVDREQVWVDQLRERFADRLRFTAVRADVADLTALDGTFDLVTCQTVLLHVHDVPAALAQMRQRLVPGGLLLLVEPDNLFNRLPTTSILATLSPSDYGQLASLWWAFERGREALGFGREWIAELLPKMLVDCGFAQVRVWQNDRVWPWSPPYDSEEVAAIRSELPSSDADDSERDEARTFALAGGLHPETFDDAWRLQQEVKAHTMQAIEGETYSTVGDGHVYVFTGRRR